MRQHCNKHDFCIKIEITVFYGDLYTKESLDWIIECDRVKEHLGFSEEKMVKLVAYNMKCGASS